MFFSTPLFHPRTPVARATIARSQDRYFRSAWVCVVVCPLGFPKQHIPVGVVNTHPAFVSWHHPRRAHFVHHSVALGRSFGLRKLPKTAHDTSVRLFLRLLGFSPGLRFTQGLHLNKVSTALRCHQHTSRLIEQSSMWWGGSLKMGCCSIGLRSCPALLALPIRCVCLMAVRAGV